jgi:hypothetical protein
MSKDVVERIVYYTRKVAEKSSVHPAKKQPRAYTYRHQRLLKYKALMHEQIESNS